MKNKLQDLFHSGMSYAFLQVSEGISEKTHDQRSWGRVNLNEIAKAYRNFKSELMARGELTATIEHELNQQLHAIFRIEQYFDSTDDWLTINDAHIYLDYIIHEHEHFVDIAKDIDLSYMS